LSEWGGPGPQPMVDFSARDSQASDPRDEEAGQRLLQAAAEAPGPAVRRADDGKALAASRAAWRRVRLAGTVSFACAAAIAGVLLLTRGGTRSGAAAAEESDTILAPAASEVVGLFAAASEPFTCAKYGCLDVRSPTHPCQCSRFCVKDGTCCPDYQATCAKLTPATNARLGRWAGCKGAVAPPPRPAIFNYVPRGLPLRVKLMSYNPEWWHTIEQMGGNGNGPAKIVMAAEHPVPLDFIGFQEFYDPWFGFTRPGPDASAILRSFTFLRGEVGGPVGTIIGFKHDAWSLITRGQQFVAEDKPGPLDFGKRIVLWARFTHRTTGKTVFVANHHGPLPLNTGGLCGCATTASNLLRTIAYNAQPGDAVFLMGDFNADTHSGTIGWLSKYLRGSFDNIDHIFHNLPPQAVLARTPYGTGGSDHCAISLTVNLPAR